MGDVTPEFLQALGKQSDWMQTETYKNFLKNQAETDKNAKLHPKRSAEALKEKGQVPKDVLVIEELDRNQRLHQFSISPPLISQHASTVNEQYIADASNDKRNKNRN